MDDLLALAASKLELKPACVRCGQPFLQDSATTCSACLRDASHRYNSRRRYPLKCDCGALAVVVVYVRMKIGGALSQEPLPMCRECLEIEIDTVVNYL